MKKIRTFLASAVLAALSSSALPVMAQTIYVATSGNDVTGIGTQAKPYASLAKAQLAIQTSTCGTRSQAATVNIGQGTYYLALSPTNPGTLLFSCKDSGTSTHAVTWQPNASNTAPVVVSGGVLVGGVVGKTGLGLTWTRTTGYSNVWQVSLPSSVGSFTLQPFESLYYNPAGSTAGPVRRLRSRVESLSSTSVGYYWNPSGTPPGCYTANPPGGGSTLVSASLCNLGTFLRVANTITPGSGLGGTGLGTCTSVTDSNTGAKKCLDRFYYNSGDAIQVWQNLNGAYDASKLSQAGPPCDFASGSGTYPQGDIGLLLFDAWTADSMRIACIDTTDGVIFLQGATKGNAGVYNFFGPAIGHRFVIENARDNFFAAANNGQTQLWFLDRSTSSPVLYYIAGTGEAPNSDAVIIPQLPYSAQLSNQFPQGNDFVGGSLLWAQAPTSGSTGLSNVTFSKITFQIDNFVPTLTGFNNDNNGDLPVPQAIDCEGCQNVTFNGINVNHTSASGILISSAPANTSSASAATGDFVENSSFMDIGDSGIRVGHTVNSADLSTSVVSGLTITNNLIDGYSRVLPDGEGIAEGNGQGITITHNDINDGYHAGISICQLGCGPFDSTTHAGINGSNVTAQLNHLANMMQGITSDGGSLYFNVGNANGSGTNNLIDSNLVHDTSDASVIDGVGTYPGTGYGGEGIYLDAQTADAVVENNVVYHVSADAAWMTEGPTTSFAQTAGSANSPNKFENNIFALAIQGMFAEQNPWPAGSCPSGTFTTAQFFWNIWNTDLTENLTTGLGNFAQGMCTNSCGQPYYQFQDFEANAYWRANTSSTGYPLFCSDPNAFHVLANPSGRTVPGSCPAVWHSTDYDWLTFDSPPLGSATWQHGQSPSTPVTINEDDAQDTTSVVGTCSFNPSFGTSGSPSDYHLTTSPNSQFQITNTNTTISSAGRVPRAAIPTVPPTFPTYTYPTSTQGW